MTHAATLPLAQFQSAFADALLAPADAAADSPLADLLAQPAFAVYRNTVAKGCVDALEANFPSVARLVGREWFRAAAALHVIESPPRDARLLFYGAQFPQFLRDFEPAAELPYLAGVAQLDALWCAAHAAAEAPQLDASTLARLPPEQLGTAVLRLHPATRWAWFDTHPIYTIWQRNRPSGTTHPAEADDSEIAWRAEGALLTRCDGVVRWQIAGRAEVAFLAACADGATLSQAAEAASMAASETDIAALLAGLLRAGAFCELDGPAAATPTP